MVAGQDFELNPISLGGKPLWVSYRPVGTSAWKRLAGLPLRGWVQRVVLPAADVLAPGIELSFSLSSDGHNPLLESTVTVMPALAVNTTPLATKPAGTSDSMQVTFQSSPASPLELKWNPLLDADYFKIYRDDQLLVETAVSWFADRPTTPAPKHDYRIEAWRDGALLTQATVIGQTPNCPTQPVVPSVRPVLGGAIVEWPSTDLNIASFQITSSALPAVTVPAARYNRFPVPITGGPVKIEIAAVNQSGVASQPVRLEANSKVLKEIHTQPLDQAKPAADVAITDGIATFSGGKLQLLDSPAWDLSLGGSISFELNFQSAAADTRLIEHGGANSTRAFGRIIHLLSDKRIQVGGYNGQLYGSVMQPDQWHTVTVQNDVLNRIVRLIVDGKEAATSKAMEMDNLNPYSLSMGLGGFRGSIRNLVITTASP